MYTWTTTIDNITYNIKFTDKIFKKELSVNQVPITLDLSRTFGITRETAFNLGSRTAILVSIDKEVDIAIDDTFLTSGKKYVTVKSMPIWTFIFLGLILLIYIFSYDSICAALFTLEGIYFLIRASIEPSLNTKKRILLCLFITLSMHLFYWNILYILLYIL